MGRHQIICAAIFMLVSSNSGEAQVSPKSGLMDMYVTCIKEGIASGEVSLQPGAFIRFTCHGDTAEAFFEKLGQYDFKGKEATTELGKIDTREFDEPDKCWRKVENPDGSAANEYGCNLNFHGSGALMRKVPVTN